MFIMYRIQIFYRILNFTGFLKSVLDIWYHFEYSELDNRYPDSNPQQQTDLVIRTRFAAIDTRQRIELDARRGNKWIDSEQGGIEAVADQQSDLVANPSQHVDRLVVSRTQKALSVHLRQKGV